MTINLNQEVQIMETEETVPFKLNSLYLRNDGKVVRIVIKEHAEDYKDSNGVDRISELTLEGSDGYFYSYKDGRAYTHGTNYEMFLVAEVNCDLRTTSQDLDQALAKLINVDKPW